MFKTDADDESASSSCSGVRCYTLCRSDNSTQTHVLLSRPKLGHQVTYKQMSDLAKVQHILWSSRRQLVAAELL